MKRSPPLSKSEMSKYCMMFIKKLIKRAEVKKPKIIPATSSTLPINVKSITYLKKWEILLITKIDKIKVMITAIKPTISCSESGKTLRIKNDAKWEYFRAIKMLINIEQKLNIVIIKPFLYPL